MIVEKNRLTKNDDGAGKLERVMCWASTIRNKLVQKKSSARATLGYCNELHLSDARMLYVKLPVRSIQLLGFRRNKRKGCFVQSAFGNLRLLD
jgi:hypothetical protein